MRIQVYINTRAPHNVEFLGAFAEGLRKNGEDVRVCEAIGEKNYIPADLHVLWSMHIKGVLRGCAANGTPFLCIERGYIDRMRFASVNLNGLNGRSMLDLSDFQHNNERRERHGWHINPRHSEGREVVIMGQVPGDASLEGANIYEWARQKIRVYEDAGYTPIFKPHPLDQNMQGQKLLFGAPVTHDPIDDILEDAALVHTYSSNSGVDAWLRGVPALADSEVSMIHKWQTPTGLCLGARQWLNDLSFRQYNAEEMASGEAWRILRAKLEDLK